MCGACWRNGVTISGYHQVVMYWVKDTCCYPIALRFCIQRNLYGWTQLSRSWFIGPHWRLKFKGWQWVTGIPDTQIHPVSNVCQQLSGDLMGIQEKEISNQLAEVIHYPSGPLRTRTSKGIRKWPHPQKSCDSMGLSTLYIWA